VICTECRVLSHLPTGLPNYGRLHLLREETWSIEPNDGCDQVPGKKTDWDRGPLIMASGALSTGGRNWRLPRKGEGGCQNIARLVGVKQRHSRSPIPERELSTLSIISFFPFHVWRHKTAGDAQALLLNFLTSQTLGGRALPRLRSFGHFFGNCIPVIKNIRPSYSGVNCEEHAGIAQFEDGERWINEITSTSR